MDIGWICGLAISIPLSAAVIFNFLQMSSPPLTITAVPAPALEAPVLQHGIPASGDCPMGTRALGPLVYVIRLVTLYRAGWLRKWCQLNWEEVWNLCKRGRVDLMCFVKYSTGFIFKRPVHHRAGNNVIFTECCVLISCNVCSV